MRNVRNAALYGYDSDVVANEPPRLEPVFMILLGVTKVRSVGELFTKVNNAGPLLPDIPVGPVEPVWPVGPVGPVEPDGPVEPVGPVGPDGPVEPVGPVPSGPVEPVEPVGPDGPVGPVSPAIPKVVWR